MRPETSSQSSSESTLPAGPHYQGGSCQHVPHTGFMREPGTPRSGCTPALLIPAGLPSTSTRCPGPALFPLCMVLRTHCSASGPFLIQVFLPGAHLSTHPSSRSHRPPHPRLRVDSSRDPSSAQVLTLDPGAGSSCAGLCPSSALKPSMVSIKVHSNLDS